MYKIVGIVLVLISNQAQSESINGLDQAAIRNVIKTHCIYANEIFPVGSIHKVKLGEQTIQQKCVIDGHTDGSSSGRWVTLDENNISKEGNWDNMTWGSATWK